MIAYNVYLNGKRIDTVFATETGTIAEREYQTQQNEELEN